jgi:hypothetical protein
VKSRRSCGLRLCRRVSAARRAHPPRRSGPLLSELSGSTPAGSALDPAPRFLLCSSVPLARAQPG